MFLTRRWCESCFFEHRLLQLVVDTPVANAAAKVAQTLAGGITDEQKASVEVLLNSIRSSRMFPKFVEMLKEQNVRKLRICSTN